MRRNTALFAYNLTALQNLYLRLQTTLYKYSPLFAPAIHGGIVFILLCSGTITRTHFSVCGNKSIIQLVEKIKLIIIN